MSQTVQWLTHCLDDKPVGAWTILAEAKDRGFGQYTVQRAAPNVGVEKVKNRAARRFIWSLPPTDPGMPD